MGGSSVESSKRRAVDSFAGGADAASALKAADFLYPGMKIDSWLWKAYAESGLHPADKPVRDFGLDIAQVVQGMLLFVGEITASI